MSAEKRQVRVVRDYIAALNRRDMAAIEGIIGENCRLIDSCGGWVEGRETCLEASRRFLALPIEFRLEIDEIVARPPDVLVTGQMHSSDAQLARDRLWRARSDGKHLIEWQSYASAATLQLARLLMPEAANVAAPGSTGEGEGEGEGGERR